MIIRSYIIVAAAISLLPVSAPAQRRSPKQPGPATSPQTQGAPGMMGPQKPKPKKYEEVITKDAKTQNGMFKVHRLDNKIYWEIPANLLGRDLLWETEVAELPHNLGFPGTSAGIHVVQFIRHEDKLFLLDRSFEVRAKGDDGTKTGVKENTVDPIAMAFNVETEGPDKAPVIDVTQLFSGDGGEFGAGPAIGMGGVDPNRSYVDSVKDFPENIETRSMLTFAGGGGQGRFFLGGGGAQAATVLVHYSLDLLPKEPMRGRLKDSRIGYFTTSFDEYGSAENRTVERQYINRFRLEKKDPKADLSEPVRPLVFYLPKEVPDKWRPYLKAGIEDWAPVFEKIGFKNAIQCKDAPANADWDPEDARYNVVRWAPSRTENAEGRSIQDPRSGETLSAHVVVWNDLVKLLEDWDFTQTAAADPTSSSLPYSDEKMGGLIRYVICHEVGHTLGLEHNFKASVAYTIQQLRDPQFMKTHGTSASIMSYSRMDYVAQPGDGVTQFANRIGPYDYFAIEYGYKPIPGALNPEGEKPTLDQLLSRQVSDRTLRFGNYLYPGIDPGMQNENISDDPVEAGKLGCKNIDEIATGYLLPLTTKFGEDYSLLQEMEQNLMEQRLTEILHVVPLVGGVVQTDYHAGRGGEVFNPVPRAQQENAVKFLVRYAFGTPTALLNPEVINRLQPSGTVSMATVSQNLVLTMLLSQSRIQRMLDNEAQNGDRAFTVAQLVGDLSSGVWSELGSPIPQVDIYRRTLQRSYLNLMDGKINGNPSSGGDLRELERTDLQRIAGKIDRALPKTKDRMTFAHLQSCRTDIGRILQDKYSKSSESSGFDFGMFFGIDRYTLSSGNRQDDCWTPYRTIADAVEEVRADEKK